MTKQEIGKKCKEARGAKTRYRLAKESGLTMTQIERIEEGKENYTIDILNRYLKALGLEININDVQ